MVVLSGFPFLPSEPTTIRPDGVSGQRARHAGTSEIEKNDQTRDVFACFFFASSGLGLDGCRSKTPGGWVGRVSVCLCCVCVFGSVQGFG